MKTPPTITTWRAAREGAKHVARPPRATHMLLVAALAVAGCLAHADGALAQNAAQPVASNVSWPLWGGDLHNTHSAAAETKISPANVSRLQVKWTYKTNGNVSAIPTVVDNTLYVPDWGWPWGMNVLPFGGGKLHAVDATTGKALWSKSMSSYGGNAINDLSRTSPAIAGDLIIVGDVVSIGSTTLGMRNGSGATLYGINRHTGALVWKTVLDSHPLAIVTQSPTVYDGRVYVGVASQEEAANKNGYDCCTFRGSMHALDVATGKLLWSTSMAPKDTQFSGVAVWGSSPAVDEARGVVYIATGNNYTLPPELDECLAAHAGDIPAQERECLARFDRPDNYANAILALDLDTGAIRWAHKLQNTGGWTLACNPSVVPTLPTTGACANATSQDEDFGQAPMLLTTMINGAQRDLVVAGQKSGVFFALDPDASGAIVWATPVGPGGTQGGMEFGAASDGNRIYAQVTNDKHTDYTIVAGAHKGEVTHGGLWAALDAATGKVLWQTPDPSGLLPLKGWYVHPTGGVGLGAGAWGIDLGPLTLTNGVLFAGSLDREGHMYGFDAATGAILWSFESGGSVMSAPAVVDGVVYWGSGYQSGTNSKKLYAFELPH